MSDEREISFEDAWIGAVCLRPGGIVEVQFDHIDGYEPADPDAQWSGTATLRLEGATLLLVTVAGDAKQMFHPSDAVGNWRIVDRENVLHDAQRLRDGVEFVSCWLFCGISGTDIEIRASRAVLTDVKWTGRVQ
jgi:hypothetical protein